VIEDFDPASASVRRDPYPFYRELRRARPIVFIPRLNAWGVVRHDDVARVLSSPDEFSSRVMRGADPVLLGSDPPAHTHARALAVCAFDAASPRALRPFIVATAEELLRPLIGAGTVDVVARFTAELPLRVMAHLLGIEADRLVMLAEASRAIAVGPDAAREPGIPELLRGYEIFLRDLVARRARERATDVLSRFLDAGGSAEQACSLAKLLIVAGSETTTNLLGNALLAILAMPTLQERLRREPHLVAQCVEETLRFDSPVQIVLRVAARPVRLHSVDIERGHTVAAFIGSANRDERLHPAPDEFRLARSEPHLAFGTAAHHCLGAALARLEATIAFGMLLERTQRLTAAAPLAGVPRVPALQLRGPARLLVEM